MSDFNNAIANELEAKEKANLRERLKRIEEKVDALTDVVSQLVDNKSKRSKKLESEAA